MYPGCRRANHPRGDRGVGGAQSARHSDCICISGVVLAADESMSVNTSSLPEPADGTTRHWYLRVTGEHDAESASSTRATQDQDDESATPAQIHSIRPNPSHGRMTLAVFTMREARRGEARGVRFDRTACGVVRSRGRAARAAGTRMGGQEPGRTLAFAGHLHRSTLARRRQGRTQVLVMPWSISLLFAERPVFASREHGPFSL